MSRLRKIGLGAIVLAGSALLLGSLGGAQADTITDYTIAYCQGDSGYCGGSGVQSVNYGTVVVDVATGGTSATITVNLTNGTIDDPTNASAVFDLSGTISSYSVTSNTGCDSAGCGTWSIPGGGSPYTVDEDNSPGFGNFPEGLTCANNFVFLKGETTCGTSIVITVNGTGLAVSSNSLGYFLALDVVDSFETNPEVATGSPLATPLPGALAMLAPVLGGGFLALRRRRRKLSAAAA